MSQSAQSDLDRRGFLLHVVPACSVACLVACLAAGDLLAQATTGKNEVADEELHKFDVESTITTTSRRRVGQEYRALIGFIETLQSQMDERELIRLLELYSAEVGRKVGTRQAERAPDTTFETYVATFRPPRYADTLTHQVVEDTEKAFELRVTECVWASVFRDAGLGGEIGHAAICNMDYFWPQAFNGSFKMVRTKTLMQGHDCCNHRYIDTA
jgi:hypothetical protein